MTFMKEITVLATNKEYGKMKSLMKGVFIGGGIFLAIALVTTKFTLPHFLERIRVEEGSLGILIVSVGFIGAVAPVYSNALQALKRFKTISFLNIIGAPLRFLTMVLTMPFRALSGYFIGQAATPAFSIIASVWVLRKELSVPAEPYWNKPTFRRFTLLFLGIATYSVAGGILSLIEQTTLRQKLPNTDSAGYYMATRFSDIAGFIHASLITVLFPFTAALATKGRQTRPLVIKTSFAMLSTGTLLAIVFAIFGESILTILPNGNIYTEYAWAIPCLILISSIAAIQSFHINAEISAGRFGFLKWWIPVNLLFAALVLLITGCEYLTFCLPENLYTFLSKNNISSLKMMVLWFAVSTLLKTAITIYDLFRQNKCSPTDPPPTIQKAKEQLHIRFAPQV
jgi:O-antigen/teichoic acid export membrane protein